MELKQLVEKTLQGGIKGSKAKDYAFLYKRITGKEYEIKCASCAAKKLHSFLRNWLNNQNKNL